MNQVGFERRFSDETKCFEYLDKMRWPDGPRCSKCGGENFWHYSKVLKCTKCRKNLSILAGTVFQDTHLPLTLVITDGLRGYNKLNGAGFKHEVRKMNKDKNALPHIHTVISLLKRWLLGTYQGAVKPDYLDYYLE